MSHSFARYTVLCSLLCSLALVGCGQQQSGTSDQATPLAAPTVSSIFGVQPTMLPEPTRDSLDPGVLPTTDPTVIAQATITALGENQLKEVSVYAETLSADWSLQHSFQTNIDLRSRGYVHQGRYAIKAQPQYTTGILYFTLNSTAKDVFRRDRVQAVRFYLSGGPEPINNETLTVAVVGSNLYPYWVENDKSVKIDGRVTDDQPVFSETRLSFLGIKTAIPRKTYAEVTVWLDSLLYDPLYTYVTGFYLKTDKASVPAFYVDRVSLLVLPKTR
ncbi:hypothetical protein EKD04_012175 [Chloroflexales bacterium ZM16-3]|nr:hypothetical protein [Chloroflexales bacterium ZM16-3]